jgi:hypothetical protein
MRLRLQPYYSTCIYRASFLEQTQVEIRARSIFSIISDLNCSKIEWEKYRYRQLLQFHEIFDNPPILNNKLGTRAIGAALLCGLTKQNNAVPQFSPQIIQHTVQAYIQT